MIFYKEKYYIYTNKILYHFGKDYQEAIRYYENIREIEKEGMKRYYMNGKFHLELYPDEMEILLKSLENYKFMIDNSRFIDCEKEKIKMKSFDIEFLTQYLYSLYIEYLKEKNKGKG